MKGIIYKVKKGETLESLAEDFGISVYELRSFHNLWCEDIRDQIGHDIWEGKELTVAKEKLSKEELQQKEEKKYTEEKQQKQEQKEKACGGGYFLNAFRHFAAADHFQAQKQNMPAVEYGYGQKVQQEQVYAYECGKHEHAA